MAKASKRALIGMIKIDLVSGDRKKVGGELASMCRLYEGKAEVMKLCELRLLA